MDEVKTFKHHPSMFQFLKAGSSVLGMNARNLDFIRPYNPHSVKVIADDKLLSKRILKKGSVPVPPLLGKIRSLAELDSFSWESLPGSFVLKPNRGFGGSGIIVVYGRKKNRTDAWVRADGSVISIDFLREHIRAILEGTYSLSNTPDIAFFEERLKLHKVFKPYAYKGIPDIRVIVFNKVPVMAMLRLPTRESDGKANLQLGGIGVGIDLASGITTSAVLGKKSKLIEYLPKSRLLLSGIRIPYWNTILDLAVQSQIVSGLGFLGADVAIDRDRGPVFLEINARPGLSIQVANQAGLKERLSRVLGLKIKTKERGVRVGMNLFGGEIEEEVEEISGKRIIKTVEKVTLLGKNSKEIEVLAKIDTGAYLSSLDLGLARQLGYEKLIEDFGKIDLSQFSLTPGEGKNIQKIIMAKYGKSLPLLTSTSLVRSASGLSIRPIISLPFVMDGRKVHSRINLIDRSDMKYKLLIGRKDLRRFFIAV